MLSTKMATAAGLLAALACAGPASAQSNLNGFGAYPTPPTYNSQGGYVVGPALTGVGGTYGYVQQNTGRGMGMSPNAYYSLNYFTNTPMSPSYPYAYPYTYKSGYSSPYVDPGLPLVNTYTTPANTGVYSSANSTYYRTRRAGPIRGLFGRR